MENCKTRKKAEKELEKELKANRTPTVTSTSHVNYIIGSTTLVTGPTSTESSASAIGSGDNAASTVTNSWDRRKATTLSQWS